MKRYHVKIERHQEFEETLPLDCLAARMRDRLVEHARERVNVV